MKYLERLIGWIPFRSIEERENYSRLFAFLNREGIDFRIEQFNDETGVYFVAESTNTPGKHIITSGKNLSDLDRNIKDAIFTAYEVPAFLCSDKDIKSNLVQENVLKYAV